MVSKGVGPECINSIACYQHYERCLASHRTSSCTAEWQRSVSSLVLMVARAAASRSPTLSIQGRMCDPRLRYTCKHCLFHINTRYVFF